MEAQTVSVAFGQGVDTKTDPKVSAKPILIQDGVFTAPHQIAKRFGYDVMTTLAVGGSISDIKSVQAYGDEITCCALYTPDSGPTIYGLHSYSQGLKRWVFKGPWSSFQTSKKVLSAQITQWNTGTAAVTPTGIANPECATDGTYIVYAYEAQVIGLPATNPYSKVYFSVLDTVTQANLGPHTEILSAGVTCGSVKVVKLLPNFFCIFYVSYISSVYQLCYQTITIDTSGGTLGAETIVGSIIRQSSPDNSPGFCYDVAETSSGAILGVAKATAMTVYRMDTTGTITTASGNSTIGKPSPISIAMDDALLNAWVYYADSSTTLLAVIYDSSTGSQVLAGTVVSSTYTDLIRQVTAYNISSTEQYFFFSIVSSPSSTYVTNGVFTSSVYTGSLTTAGVVGSEVPSGIQADIYTKIFTVNSRKYMGVMNLSQTNPIGFIVDLTNINPSLISGPFEVAKFLPGMAEGNYLQGYDEVNGAYVRPKTFGMRYPGFLAKVIPGATSTQFIINAGFVVTLSLQNELGLLNGNLSVSAAISTQSAQMGSCLIYFDVDGPDSNQSIVHNDTLVLNGSLVNQYDGDSVTELGFSVDPDQISLKGATSGGVLGAGTFLYYVTYSWTDYNGKQYESAPSPAVAILFTTGTANEVTISWPMPLLTQKVTADLNISIYRTIANGTTAYLVANVPSYTGFGSILYGGFVDSALSDAVLLTKAPLYTQSGTILPNTAPPPSMVMWTNENRLWAVDSENDETMIQYSKTSSPGSGTAFSFGLLEYVVDSRGGSIHGASPMDEKTVILKENAIGVFIGDGANDSGTGATITPLQYIPTTTGCSSSKSVILFSEGILFKASNDKGIYILSRGLQTGYFGAPVDAYNSQDITASILVPGKTQILLVTSSGMSLLYDYFVSQWSVFSNYAGLSATAYGSKLVYARSGSNAQDNDSIFIQNNDSYLDNATQYALQVKLQWIKASSVQNFQRCRRIEMLGDFSNGTNPGHGIQISTAYDFETDYSQAVPYSFGAGYDAGPFQYQQIMKRQKCDAFQLFIEEITTGQSGEYMDLTDLGLEIAVKKGLNKRPRWKGVG